MSQPYVGEIKIFAGNYAPQGWATCDGALMAIAELETLFNLIGTTYGGDGQSTFALPNLVGRVPVHQGTGPSGAAYNMGEQGGTEQETLTLQQIPNHTHPFTATTNGGTTSVPTGNILAANNAPEMFSLTNPVTALSAQMISPAGGSQPHDNVMPTVAVRYIIALFGNYPQQS